MAISPLGSALLLSALSLSVVACGSDGGGNNSGDADASVADPNDRDGDGLSNDDESTHGTDPDNPDSDGDGLSDGDEVRRGTDPLDSDSDDDGILDGDELLLGTDPRTPDAACADESATANAAKRPVDIILVIDSSSSMNGEIAQVESNLNVNLANILESADIDYQIILLADYPPGSKNTICIGMPLSGHDCSSPPSTPVNTATFKHYSTYVGSHDAYERIIEDYDQPDELDLAPNGWGVWLREDAQKVFLIISDDEPTGYPDTAAEFDSELLALDPAQFGTTDDRNYVFHSIIGMQANSPETDPWLASDPVTSSTCGSGSEGPAEEYQLSSILTGGLRFPLCNNDNFNVVFQAMAQSVVIGSTLDCSYIPTPPNSGDLDFSRIVAYFTPTSATSPTKLTQVSGPTECESGAYFVDGDVITLCPDTCLMVQADSGASLEFHVACESQVD